MKCFKAIKAALCTGMIILPVFPLIVSGQFRLNDQEYFEKRGMNVLVFHNWYDGYFGDSKITGIEFIHHGVRTVTNGDVRLNPTPGQWEPIPESVTKEVDRKKNRIDAHLIYPEYRFEYTLRTEAKEDNIILSVHLDKALPAELEGRAGLNLEFLPAAYFEKAYLMDEKTGLFPRYPGGPMIRKASGEIDPHPLAEGKRLVLAPGDPFRQISVEAAGESVLSFYDGRNQAQNGWYVVRTQIPPKKTGKVVEWIIRAAVQPDWVREPVIAHSQIGYHPDEKKVAVIELDKLDTALKNTILFKVEADGTFHKVFSQEPVSWGDYLRYHYLTFDFSPVIEPGLYVIEYGSQRSATFQIGRDIYKSAWNPTLDVFFPVQMDHMMVNEAYRVWHGAAHLDDALQAPPNHNHFDLYAQGPETGTQYQPGEHVPGLNIGGWFDAGDYDIRTQSQYATLEMLVKVWEKFGLQRDETLVDQHNRYTDMHVPDGVPDLLQQIEHGTLGLIAQHRAFGRAINGIIVPDLSQYTHLGDAVTMTDNKIYNPDLKPDESDGFTSGKPDDRWVFTNKSAALNFGSISALAAASRALRGYNDALADECLETARRVWSEEKEPDPDEFRSGNTTGGRREIEQLKAAVQLLKTTGDPVYAEAVKDLWSRTGEAARFVLGTAVEALPLMDAKFAADIRTRVMEYRESMKTMSGQNPYGVPISTGTWAGSGWVIGFAVNHYNLYKAFPDLIDKEPALRGLQYILGCHPGSNLSLVSGVGARSKTVAYGNNRADFSFIAGGVVPGILIVKPDFPENKEDWPFFWGENEYVISLGASYIYLVNAVNDLLNES